MRRALINSAPGVYIRRLAADLHCRTGAESWLAPDRAVISHPKSGRTWLRVMLEEAGVGRVCFSHAGSGEQASLPIAALEAITRSWHGKHILLLVRDPRDVATSFFFQATRRTRVYSGSFHEFLRSPQFGLERAILFNLLWVDQRKRFKSFDMLSYEELYEQTQATLSRAATFLIGRNFNEFELEKAVEKATFQVLHAMELSGEGRRRWGFRLSPGDRSDPESFKTRRGIVGGWREYFSAEDRAFASEILERHAYFPRVGAALKGIMPNRAGLPDAA